MNNVDYRFLPIYDKETKASHTEYVRIIDEFDNFSLDFCLVDGAYREFCAMNVINKLKPAGMLIIDNVNWYLPSDSYSPNSRTMTEGPNGAIWKKVMIEISGWRQIWTSSGVTDTAFFFKPCY